VKWFDTFTQKWEETGKQQELPSPLRDLIDGFQKELHQPLPPLSSEAQLLAKDTFLRILAAHVQLTPSNHEFWVEGNDSILDSALRAGLALNYGCSSGNCGLCKARVVSGELRKIRHHDYILSEVEQRLGYRLMCSHTAVTDVVLEANEAHQATDIPLQQIEVKVKKLEYVNDNLLLLSVQTPRTQTLRFLAGQTVKLTYQGHSADYFIASCPCDGRNLQFHLSRFPSTPFVETVFTSVKSDHTLLLEGPQGDFVLTEDSTRPTLFLAYGYGFAPIQSLITQAMALDTVESLHLYWLTSPVEGHYLSNLCRSWADALDHFHYTLFSVETDNHTQVEQLLGRVVKIHHADLSNMDVYLAGPESFVTLADHFFRQHHLSEAQLHLGYVK
jgi:CDP-4-dehydro-6-deoxyglucose reductase